MQGILETKDLVKYYGTGENMVKAIDHTDISIAPGQFTAVVGRSGSGKSTLLHMGRDKNNGQRGHEENSTADVVSGGLDLVRI